jgi:hypothetical protein
VSHEPFNIIQIYGKPAFYLNGPINENIRADPSSGTENPVERSSPGVFHDKAQVGLLQTDPVKADDVLVLQKPEQLSLLESE